MITGTIADIFVTLIVTVTSTATNLRQLITAANGIIPPGTVVQVSLTPAADITIQDLYNSVGTTIVEDNQKNIPSLGCLENIKLKTAGANTTCIVDLYITAQ